MALSKSTASGGNVTSLDDARKSRAISSSGHTQAHDLKAEFEQDELANPALDITTQSAGDSGSTEPDIKQKPSNRRFDKVKVERIKAEIARGEYEINYLHVADKFIEHERYS